MVFSCKIQWYHAGSCSGEPWCTHYNAICNSAVKNTIELRAMAPEIAARKLDLGAKAKQDEAHEPECSHVLMVQMSKHMVMQWGTIPFCNSLFEQSVHVSLVTSLQCGEESVECGVWSVKCSVECEMWSGKCRVWCVECGVWSVKCKVWSVECKV